MATKKATRSSKSTTTSPLKAFETALTLLHKKQYKRAQQAFVKIRSGFPDELQILGRVDSYLKVCERQLTDVKAKTPNSSDELFDVGVLEHNLGNYAGAIQNYEAALKKTSGDADHIYYALASSEVLRGNSDQALKHLEKAIKIRPETRFMAKNDPDMELLKSSEEFQQLTTTRR